MNGRKDILKNITQPEERLFLAKVLDQADFCCRRFEKTFTLFCDPVKLSMALEVLGFNGGYKYKVFGGYEGAERNKIGFCPEYDELEENDFDIAAVNIAANAKFASDINHRDFLGSILGLGIDRGKVGDIIVFEKSATAFVCSDIAEYISANLERVGRNAVKTSVMPIGDVKLPSVKTEEKYVTLASMRADLVIGTAFNLSRGKAQELIEGQKVFVNWTLVKNGSKPLKEGDIISARGFGRTKIGEIQGITKKDKIGIILIKYI